MLGLIVQMILFPSQYSHGCFAHLANLSLSEEVSVPSRVRRGCLLGAVFSVLLLFPHSEAAREDKGVWSASPLTRMPRSVPCPASRVPFLLSTTSPIRPYFLTSYMFQLHRVMFS